jgi:hypothetical protein
LHKGTCVSRQAGAGCFPKIEVAIGHVEIELVRKDADEIAVGWRPASTEGTRVLSVIVPNGVGRQIILTLGGRDEKV